MSRNNITGDRLVSKISNTNFDDGFDKIDFKPYHCECKTKCYKGCANTPSGGKGDAYEDVMRDSGDSLL